MIETGQKDMGDASRTESGAVQKLRVDLTERSYDILIGRGIVAQLGTSAARLGARAAFIVTDRTVAALYLQQTAANLAAAGLRVASHAVEPGEAAKSYSILQEVCEAILAAKIERGDLVIALGGGVVGDLAGFAAAIIRRGIRFIQVPTTLLAQVDSSVGGKTGINSPHGKNLIGAFHQPSLVLADTSLLDTLSPREFRAGYAEVVKYGLIDNPGFFAWLEKHGSEIFTGGSEREEAVAVSCRSKAAIVSRDEREDGDRALLNLGHTFAHALERICDYATARLVHGEAVSIGLALAFRFSSLLNLASPDDHIRIAAHLKAMGMPTRLQDVPGGYGSVEALLDAMAQDKKVKSGKMTFILAKGIGQSFIAPDIEADRVRDFLMRETQAG